MGKMKDLDIFMQELEMRYVIPLNECLEGESQTVDLLTLEGTKKQKIKAWRKYLTVRAGVWDVHACNQIARELGFKELVK